jgi:phosphoglycerol transferase
MSDTKTPADVPLVHPENQPEPSTEIGPEPAPPPASKRRLPFETLGVAVAAWAWGAVLLRVWDMPMRLPFDTRSDATLISAMVKTIEERGWYLNQPRLGAPFGQQFYDFPHGGESFQLFAMKALVTVTGDWGLAINLYFLLGFGVLAGVTFLVLRHLRFGPIVAGIAALIFTFMPYHFTHGEMHLWRSTYYSAPLAALLLVWATAWRERFLKDPGLMGWKVHRANIRWPRVAGAVAIAVLIAGTETMTTGFTMVLLGSGALVAAIRWREPSRLLVAIGLIAVMGITFVVLSYPTLNFYRAHGTNDSAARRLVTESELYGLKISRLLTPQGGHRSETLSEIGGRAQDKSYVRSEGGQALGFLGIAGFLGALWGAFAGRWRRERPDIRPGWDRSALREDATTFTLLALLFGTIGGLAILVSMAGFSQIRVWNRIMLIIAFFAMIVVLRWSELITERVRSRFARPKPILAGLALLVLAFGLWDAIPPVRQPYPEIEAQHASDRAFVAQIEAEMPEGAKILQLPIIEFPEAEPVGKMIDYDHLRAYLADNGTLQWSYGSIKGRPDAAWQVTLRDKVGPIGALPAILGLGFDGIWIDTYGYVGKEDEVEQIIEAVGVEPMVSPDGRFIFLNLEDFERRTAMTDEELRQAAIDILGVTPPEGAP